MAAGRDGSHPKHSRLNTHEFRLCVLNQTLHIDPEFLYRSASLISSFFAQEWRATEKFDSSAVLLL
jgi:hypothetical protein